SIARHNDRAPTTPMPTPMSKRPSSKLRPPGSASPAGGSGAAACPDRRGVDDGRASRRTPADPAARLGTAPPAPGGGGASALPVAVGVQLRASEHGGELVAGVAAGECGRDERSTGGVRGGGRSGKGEAGRAGAGSSGMAPERQGGDSRRHLPRLPA